MQQKKWLWIFLALVLLFTQAQAISPGMMGLRLGTYTEIDEPFIGVELLTGVGRYVDFNPNFEYVLTDLGSYYTINIDFHYDIYEKRRGPFFFLGAGLGFTRFDPDGPAKTVSDTGINLFTGAGLNRPGFVPYAQLKFITGDFEDTVLCVGLRFRL